MLPVLAGFLLGLVKGYVADRQSVADSECEGGFSFEKDLWGPAKEELVYRAAPLWAFPRLPYGSTAVVFAADHVLDDMKREQQMTAGTIAARFGDVMLGGLIYESAYRRQGLATAIAAHAAHNLACSWGARLRGSR